jgi:lipopolysaccharide exporter
MSNLRSQVARSGAWVFGMRFVHQVFYLGRLIILARLLDPKDFGLMGIALLTMMTLETFSQTGFQEALIQKKENIEGYLDVAWTFLLIRGIILFSIIVLIAPLVANFFETPQAKGVVQAIGLVILIQAFTNVGVVYFKKELEFHKQFIYITTGTVTDFAVAVTAAILLGSVWALLFGFVAGKIAQLIASYIIHPYRPKISGNFHKARELFGFGKWILGSTVLVFLITQGDDLLVGKLLGATMLGFYQMAYKISNTPATEITKLLSQITLPAFSKLQDDLHKLKEAYLKVVKFTSFLVFPLTGVIFALSPEFVRIFLGEKWMPMAPAMQALVLAGLIRAIISTTGPLFYSMGKPKIDTRCQVIRFIVLAICIYPFIIRLGLVGASVAVILSVLISGIFFYFYAIKITLVSLKVFMKELVIPLINTMIFVLLIYGIKSFLVIEFWEFITIVISVSIIYLLLAFISDKIFNYSIYFLIKENVIYLKGEG